MITKLTVPMAIVVAFIGLVFLVIGGYEVYVCLTYMDIMGYDTVATKDVITYLIDQSAAPFGFGVLHFIGAFILLRIHESDYL